MSIEIYGASDDLIEVDGDVREEFPYGNSDDCDGDLMALSNGCLFRIKYDQDGVWRITPVVIQAGSDYTIHQAPANDDDNYSDRLLVNGEVTWVAHASAYAS